MLKTTLLAPGESNHGFVFFMPPKNTSDFDSAELILWLADSSDDYSSEHIEITEIDYSNSNKKKDEKVLNARDVSISELSPQITNPYLLEMTTDDHNAQITRIFYDGDVFSVESDEYVEITNLGNKPIDLIGWVLEDISEGYPSFTFPSYTLAPDASIRVYTDEIHQEWGGFSFRFSTSPVWNNKDPDVAVLYNAHGMEVSRKSYRGIF